MDFCLSAPALHRILPDHYGSLTSLLQRLAARGYRRPAFLLNPEKDRRIHHRWSAAFRAYQEWLPPADRIPILLSTETAQGAFEPWIRQHQPDLLLGHGEEPLQRLRAMGLCLPRDIGYVALNLLECRLPVAGLDQTPRLLGRLAIDTVIGLMDRGEKGCAQPTRTIALEATWIEGPTVRIAPAV